MTCQICGRAEGLCDCTAGSAENPKLSGVLGKSASQMIQSRMVLLAVNPAGGTSFGSNVNIVAAPTTLSGPGVLQQVANALPAEYQQIGATIESSQVVTFDGQQSLHVQVTYQGKDDAGNPISVPEVQYFLFSNGYEYVVTLSGPDPTLTQIAATFSTN